ncbi:histidine kinase [Streptomyces sp. NPDC088124]|uniref:sensor histidine kinase n=1 Tax=Streptomyces sp. NPDC088124 TaxID=3154654 RepID=UPI003428EC13
MNSDVAARLGRWQRHWQLAAAAAVGLWIWLYIGLGMKWPSADRGAWYLIGDPSVALGCLTALVWRRRYPLAVTLTVAVVSTASSFATGVGLLALASVSTRRRPMEIGAVTLAYLIASHFLVGSHPVESPPGSPTSFYRLVVPPLLAGIAVAAGVAVGARRVEVRTLRARAHRMEREQKARAAQAQAQERNRIAREMHDVLAHRISLIAMQAGVLNHRTNLPAHENRTLVHGIAAGSHQALEELRDVLGVLRAGPPHSELTQPSLHGIPDLVADARTSGLHVALTTTVSGTPPDTIGRTAYRIVQEGLTNATKHAPGAHIHITLERAAGNQLHVTVSNSPALTNNPARTHPPPSGYGLRGLAERVGLAGGKLDHHPTPDNGYILTAQLPWPASTHGTDT